MGYIGMCGPKRYGFFSSFGLTKVMLFALARMGIRSICFDCWVVLIFVKLP